MQTIQYITGTLVFAGASVWFEQTHRCCIAFQHVDVLVHYESRQRHGVKQNAMQPLIQKLNSKPAHNTASLAGLAPSDSKKSRTNSTRENKNLLRRRGSRSLFFLLTHQGSPLAEALAQVGELGAADLALAFNFDLVHAR